MIEIVVRGIFFFLLNCFKGKVEYSIQAVFKIFWGFIPERKNIFYINNCVFRVFSQTRQETFSEGKKLTLLLTDNGTDLCTTWKSNV